MSLVAWGSQHQRLMSKKNYWTANWSIFGTTQKAKAVSHRFTSHFTGDLPCSIQMRGPEAIQWPMCNSGPGFQLLDANIDTPAGCIGLRLAGEGQLLRLITTSIRKTIMFCIKRIDWDKRYARWVKASQWTLFGDLRRLAGHVPVAGTQKLLTISAEPRKALLTQHQYHHYRYCADDAKRLSTRHFRAGFFDNRRRCGGVLAN